MSQTENKEPKDPFKESAEHFTKLRNEKPTAAQIRSIFEKERPKKKPKTGPDKVAQPKDMDL